MITSITDFTDGYGITHPSPVFVVRSAYCNESTNESFRFNPEDGTYDENIQSNVNINYSVQYWPSQEAMDAGNRPLDFFNVNGESTFYFNPETAPTDVVADAETHFVNEVV